MQWNFLEKSGTCTANFGDGPEVSMHFHKESLPIVPLSCSLDLQHPLLPLVIGDHGAIVS